MPENNLNNNLLSRISYDDIVDVKQQSLFARLKRLFSTEVVVRNIGGKKLKIKDSDEIQYAVDRNSLRDSFNRVRSTSYNAYTRDFALAYQAARIDLFRDYETMDLDPILSAALDLFSEETTVENELGELLTIDSKNNNIKEILYNLFYDILNIEFNLSSWIRCLAKYGDFYLRLHVSPKYGVYLVEPLSSYNVERIENSDPINKSYVKFQIRPVDTSQAETLEHWQIAHFRLLTDSNFAPYGRCLIGETHIDTEFGSKYIKDLNIGDKVWSFNKETNEFELTSVLNKVCSGQKEIIKICSQHNFIGCSYDHLVLIFNKIDNVFEYKKALDIKIGDLLVINSNNNKKSKEYKINKTISEDKTCKSDRPEIDDIPEYANEEFCEFFGFMMGDGWVRKYITGGRVCFALGVDEEQNEKYLKLLEKYSGKKPYISYHGGKSRTARVYSKYLYEIMINNGFLPVSAKHKRIPEWVFELPSNLQLAFVNGLTDADSWEFTDEWVKHNCIELCNKDLLYDFKKLIQFNNIKTSIPVEDDEEKDVEICGHKCTTHGAYSFYYYLEGNLKTQIKKHDFVKSGNIFLDPVRKIEYLGEKETWDIQVGSSNSNFIANGIVVHNSMLEPARRVWKQLCLSSNSVIWTKNGPKLIKDVNNNDIIYSFDYNTLTTVPTKIKNVQMTGFKKTYEIKTEHRKFCATLEHPVMVKDGSYKQVKDLTVNDYLILPTVHDNQDELLKYPKLIIEETKTFKFDSKLQLIDESILKNNFKEFLRFFGFMLGDGWLEKYSVSFSLGDRLDKSQKYVDFIKKLNVGYNISEENTTSAYCRIHSLYFAKLLEQIGFKTGTENKRIPDWVWDLPKTYKQEILFGFADADGCDRDDNTFQLGSINEKLIRDLREIAMQCGLSTTKIWQTESKNSWSNNEICRMTLFTYKFTSRDFIEVGNNYHIEKIRSITECDKEDVYDIEVDNDLHNFIADGVVVHNCLLEDAMLISRIMRAPERRIFKIDVGNIPPADVDTFMEKIIAKSKKVPYIDEQTGDYNLRFNLQTSLDDYWLPVRGSDSGMSIDTLPGMEWTGIDDLEYIKNKMMAALKIPKSFLGFDESVGGKSVLSMEDVRFSRTISKIQKMVVSQLNKIAQVHLYAQGYRDASIVDFELKLTNPSTIFEKEKMEIWASKLENAKTMWEMSDSSGPFFAKNFIYKNIFHMSDDDIMKNRSTIVEDCKELWRLKSITEEGNDPANPFQKINPNQEGGDEGGLEEPGMGGGLPKTGGPGGEKPPGGGAGGELPKGGEPPAPEPVKESTIIEKHGEPGPNYVRPSQAGIKKASDYPFGEDPLGDKENHRKSKVDMAISSKAKELTLERFMESDLVKNLDSYLSNTEEKKELIKKSKGKSYMDEDGIIES